MDNARMKWILQQMTDHNAVIQERRDAFLERSQYWLEWKEGDKYHAVQVTKPMHKRLCEEKRIAVIGRTPRYTKDGKFITTERTWGLPGE